MQTKPFPLNFPSIQDEEFSFSMIAYFIWLNAFQKEEIEVPNFQHFEISSNERIKKTSWHEQKIN